MTQFIEFCKAASNFNFFYQKKKDIQTSEIFLVSKPFEHLSKVNNKTTGRICEEKQNEVYDVNSGKD